MEDFDLEIFDPCPEPAALFCFYNDLYFDGKLGACSVQWSSARMTLCGGVCEYQGGGCIIKLSEPLMKFRPVKELKEVLLHEMIHAWMFLLKIRDNDRGGHGDKFKAKMKEINEATCPDVQRPTEGYHITVCHSMFAEVDHYRTHHWQCERCQNTVKRATNRPPQEADCRGRLGRGADCQDPNCNWHMHLKHCAGVFKKVKEPEEFTKKLAEKEARKAKRQKRAGGASATSITSFLTGASDRLGDGSSPAQPDMQQETAAVAEAPSAGSTGAHISGQPIQPGPPANAPSATASKLSHAADDDSQDGQAAMSARAQLRTVMAAAALARQRQQESQDQDNKATDQAADADGQEGTPDRPAQDLDTHISAPAGIIIWDLENCQVPVTYSSQIPALIKALRSRFRASRVVTAAANPSISPLTEQLHTLTYCDVEVLTYFRPAKACSSEGKHSCADYMLKRALQRHLVRPFPGSQITLISSDADFKPEIHHAQALGLQVHLLCNISICGNVLKDAADTWGD
ncbi:hypothetical protein WJX74_004869 [Apatococcus lobatus]|uniref:SprT-like domain-containing protein n=1 Tax=Apatococcus lobatus TaxID=904363 RepID=A0AAW1QAT3_9CHLO